MRSILFDTNPFCFELLFRFIRNRFYDYFLSLEKIAGLPLAKATRLSVEIRGFPSLSFGRFGFSLSDRIFVNYTLMPNDKKHHIVAPWLIF